MTKKVETTYSCDDCTMQRDEKDMTAMPYNKKVHLCPGCLNSRIMHSLSIVPLGSQACSHCKGDGKVKKYYGVHSDYDMEDCPKCCGNRRRDLEMVEMA